MYGSTATGQIKDGKHLYRGLEAHFALYLALYQEYLAALIDNNLIIEKDLRERLANVVSNITNFRTEPKENLKKIHDEFGEMLRAINFKNIKNSLAEV